MIRAVGPGLETFGVKDTLPNPQVRLFTPTANNQSAEIAMNRDWDQSFDCNALKAAAESVGAFPLEPGSPDAALIKTVTAGVYSVQVSDEAEQGGIALVEIYYLN